MMYSGNAGGNGQNITARSYANPGVDGYSLTVGSYAGPVVVKHRHRPMVRRTDGGKIPSPSARNRRR
jgi:hypothetical protein